MLLCVIAFALLQCRTWSADAFTPTIGQQKSLPSRRWRSRSTLALSATVTTTQVDSARIRQLNSAPLLDTGAGNGRVCYWMWREQRCADNWALLHAQQLAEDRGVPLHVGFCLPPRCGSMTKRHYNFMLAGNLFFSTVRLHSCTSLAYVA
jgi:DNA photolyase